MSSASQARLTAAADKYALVVGVDDYAPAGHNRCDLAACETDAYLMRKVLVDKYGFAQSNVRVLLSLYPGEEQGLYQTPLY